MKDRDVTTNDANEHEVTTPTSVHGEIYDPAVTPFEEIGDDVVDVTLAAFYDDQSLQTPMRLKVGFETEFNKPENIVILLRSDQTNKVVGYSYASPINDPLYQNFPTVHAKGTALHPTFQGQKFLPLLLELRDQVLREKGFVYMVTDARTKHGFDQTLIDFYGERVFEQGVPTTGREPTRKLVIKL